MTRLARGRKCTPRGRPESPVDARRVVEHELSDTGLDPVQARAVQVEHLGRNERRAAKRDGQALIDGCVVSSDRDREDQCRRFADRQRGFDRC